MIVKGTTMVPLHFLNFWNFRIDWNEIGVVEVESSDFVPFHPDFC